jgi:pyruvate dehydrogenase E2 component (dihydrolipoamide acetyltransferase)
MTTELTIVHMPQMGVSVFEGTVVTWHKAIGDSVAEGDVLCEVVTDKVDTEVMAPAPGVVTRIVAQAGETVAVGAPLAELAPAGPDEIPTPTSPAAMESPDAERRTEPAVPVTPTVLAPSNVGHAGVLTSAPSRFDPVAAAEAAVPAGGRRDSAPLSSPVARRIAAEHQIDIASVRGGGRQGRIRKADVLAAIDGSGRDTSTGRAPAPPTPGDVHSLPRGYDAVAYEIIPTSPQRRAIAEHMVRSRHTAAHMTTEVDVNMHLVTRARAELNSERVPAGQPKLSFLSFVARAACAALAEFPDLNATFEPERLIRWQEVNLGVAVDTERGLLVPVIRRCGDLSVTDIADAIADLAERARTRRLTADDMAGGTFTISNPGSVGAASAMAIINQPQVGILGMPAIARRPWVVDGPDGEEVIVPRPILRLALTFDHRALDGAYATRCAVRIREHLESWDAAAYA